MERIDILMCAGSRDVHRLFLHSLRSCFRHFEPIGNAYIISDTPDAVRQVLAVHGFGQQVAVLSDHEVLPSEFVSLPGWCRQQAIKLFADKVAKTNFIACIGADTVILRRVQWADLVARGGAIVYYNRYPNGGRHLAYERERVGNVARILRVEPVRSLPLGDFIMDCNIFERDTLAELRSYLKSIHGEPGLLAAMPRHCETMEDRARFGEWSLYAVYLLDVIQAKNEIRNSNSKHLAQVHTARDLREFEFDSKIVHFVSKEFDVDEICHRLSERRLLCDACKQC